MKLPAHLTGQRCCRKVRTPGRTIEEVPYERASRPGRRPAAQAPHQAGRRPVRGTDRRDRPQAHRGARDRGTVRTAARARPRRRSQFPVPLLPAHRRPDARRRRRTDRPDAAHLAAHRRLARRPAGTGPACARGGARAPPGRGAQLLPGDRSGLRDPGRGDDPRGAARGRVPRRRGGADLPRLRRPGPRLRRPGLREHGAAETGPRGGGGRMAGDLRAAARRHAPAHRGDVPASRGHHAPQLLPGRPRSAARRGGGTPRRDPCVGGDPAAD